MPGASALYSLNPRKAKAAMDCSPGGFLVLNLLSLGDDHASKYSKAGPLRGTGMSNTTVITPPQQHDLFPGTREAAEFHRPGHLGFFSLNWRNAETTRDAKQTALVLDDLADYKSGKLRLEHAQRSTAEVSSVDERIEQLAEAVRGKSPHPVRQQCYPIAQLPRVLDALTTRSDFASSDFWLSQNGFSKSNRRATNVVHLNMLFADLDVRKAEHWLTRHSPEDAASILVEWCLDQDIPAPSFVTWSGNGLHMKWLLDEAAPRAAKPVWDALQLHLVGKLKAGGWPIDEGARDVSRILRIPGTYNQTGGELCRVVWVNGPDLERCARYDFNALADGKAIMPFSRSEARAHKELAKVWDANRAIAKGIDALTRPDIAVGRFLEAELWHGRLSAIRRLVELRHGTSGVPAGQRNTFAWLSANALAWSSGSADAYYRELVAVVRELAPSLTHAEVLSRASAITTRVRQPQGHDSGLYKMTNGRFRELLAITDAEAAVLFESRRTRADVNHGAMALPPIANLPFAEYLAETKRRQVASAAYTNETRKRAGRFSRRDELMPQVLAMHAAGHTQAQIAESMGLDRTTLSKWLKACRTH